MKLDVLANYLQAFATASSGQDERVYIDLFAGAVVNRDRKTEADIIGSARLALQTSPEFTKVRCVELPHKAPALEAALRADFPGRDLRVIPGDCNDAIRPLLADLASVRWAPAFAFVDPDGLEVAWPTLEALAAHKPSNLTKVELWMLFAAPGMMRTLSLQEGKLTEADVRRADRLYGTAGWRAIYELRRKNDIDGGQARAEYVNLMRWRLEHDLGYRYTHTVELRNERGTPMYDMVFATDHLAGNRIMAHLYQSAYRAYPNMQQQQARAKERDLGVVSLWEASGVDDPAPEVPPSVKYVHQPPWQPLGWTEVDPGEWDLRYIQEA